MNLTVEAIYESGVLRLLTPIPSLHEKERVRLTLETIGPKEDSVSLITRQRNNRIQVDESTAREIGDGPEYELLGC